MVTKWLARTFYLDLRSLALARIFVGLIVCADFLDRMRFCEAFLSDGGIMPRSNISPSLNNFFGMLPSFWSGSAVFEQALLLVGFCSGLCLSIGFCVRVANFAAWLILISVHERAAYSVHAGDMLLRIALLWFMVLPIARRFAFDRLKSAAPDKGDSIYGVSALGFIVQLCSVYWFSLAFKSGEEWQNGTAVYYALHDELLAKPLGTALAGFPLLLRPLSNSVWWLEALGPAFFFLPAWRFRLLAIGAFIGLHLGFAATLGIGIFPFVCIALLFGLLPREVWSSERNSQTALFGGIANSLLSCFACLFSLGWNVESVTREVHMPGVVYALGSVLRLEQEWHMFSPHPPRETGWFVFPAKLKNGTEIDALQTVLRRTSVAVQWIRPPDIRALSPSHRWSKFVRVNYLKRDQSSLEAFHRFLCAGITAQSGETPRSVRFVFMKADIPPPETAGHALEYAPFEWFGGSCS